MSLWIIQKYWPVSIGTGALGVNKSKSQLYTALNKLCGRFERYRVGSQRHDVVGRFLRASLSSFSVFVALSFRRLLVFTAGIRKKKKKEPWCCPDLWLILTAARDIGCLFPRSPEGGRQGGVRAAGSFICDGKSPCHIDSRLGVASAGNVGIVPDRCAAEESRAGGTGLFNLRVYQHSNSHLRSWDLSSDRKD